MLDVRYPRRLKLHLLPCPILLRHKHQAPLSLSRQRSCARHHTQDTVETSKTDRHPPTRPQLSRRAQHSLLPLAFTIATRFPARLSPTGKSLHLYLSTTVLIHPYQLLHTQANIAREHTLKRHPSA